MNQIQNNSFLDEVQEKDFKIKEQLSIYLHQWRWFLISIIISITFGFLYLKYTLPKYDVKAAILIKDEDKNAPISELSAFADLGILGGKSNLENEIEIFKSRTLILNVVKDLSLNISYLDNNGIIPFGIFSNTPIRINFIKGDSIVYEQEAIFNIHILSNQKFELTEEESNFKGTFSFGKVIKHPIGDFIITPKTVDNDFLDSKKYIIKIKPIDDVVSYFKKEIKVEAANDESNVITISLQDFDRIKSKAIINNLIEQHNKDAISDKNQISKNTADFINERIKYITTELSDVEQNVESYKADHKLVDMASEAEIFLKTGSDNHTLILQNETQIRLVEFVYDYLLNHIETNDLVPSNLGLYDVSIEKMIESYNKLVLEKNRLTKNSSEKHPIIQNLNVQILGIHKNLKESLLNLKESLKIKNRELQRLENEINSKISSVPKYEREYREIQRQQQIKESLYLYLLQKREETAITLAVTVSNTKIIDEAFSDNLIVSPNKKIIYAISFLLGILIPFGIIYIKRLLDTKIHGKNDIIGANLPYIGDIPLSETKDKIVVAHGESNDVSEAFRILRTNADFILKSNSNVSKSKVIFVTSTIEKEGKSFISINLASIIALSGKKVLLIGMDLRAPKILEYTGVAKTKGVTNFITDLDLTLQDVIIEKPDDINFDLLVSGDIPPNPSELLINPRVSEMFIQVREMYDYIIVDTAPVAPVTDTLLISKIANMTIYVSRANYLDKRLLNIPQTLYRENKLSNMVVLVNGSTQQKGYGYGYGYGIGYGYGNEKAKIPWYKRIFKK